MQQSSFVMTQGISQAVLDDTRPTDMASLIGSRMCHDLVSPVGAIANGLELMEMMQEIGGEEMSLVKASLNAALARIKFFRIAFGADKNGQTLKPQEFEDIVRDHFAESRLDVSLQLPRALERSEAKLGLLALMCAACAMPWGGPLLVVAGSEENPEEPLWTLYSEGARLKILPEYWQPLCKGTEFNSMSANYVEFLLLRDLTRSQRRPVHFSQEADRLTLKL